MPQLSLLIKPASSLCNLDCRYCFYHDVADKRTTASHGIMDDSTLEALVRLALFFADGQCTFAFQGGEPTLAGLDFYRRLTELQREFNTKHVQIQNAIQTNGIAIDAEWARFLAKHRFLTGISLDGPREIHDSNRSDSKGRGSFDRVMTAIANLRAAGADFNILSVVTGWSARHAEKIYRFFRREGFSFLQFIPCLDPLGEEPFKQAHSLTPERFGSFLVALFDLWYKDAVQGNPVSIRWFDNLAGMMLGAPPESCGMSGCCTCQFVVEADGSVYPCDFYVLDEWRAGNILTDGFPEMRASSDVERFIRSSLPEDPSCAACAWKTLCRGGCRRYREPFKDGLPILNLHCEAYRRFFAHAVPGLREVAAMYSKGRNHHENPFS
jgi:uncharacterized protein